MKFMPTTEKRSFRLLNATQFLGALNDNIFKLLIIYFLIHIKGPEYTNTILSLAGSLFVIPFLLFSSAAGVLADKISKRTVIVVTKAVEILVMAFGAIAIYTHSEISCYTLLFLMGAQSAAFGPSKYGIIPEIVSPQKVSKANGSLTALTYMAMILGSVFSSFLMQISQNNFLFIAFVCCVIAVLGTLTSLGIGKTEAQGSDRKITPLFVYDIYKALSLSAKRPFLFPAILGASFFLFIGGYVHLNVIPFAMESLNLSAVTGGYLFSATAVGIAIGAKLSGKLAKDRIEMGLSCLSGFCIVVVFFLLTFFAQSLTMVVILLTLLGIFGGLFVIPLESFIQVASPQRRRGQIIAASNFLSFSCVLCASFAIYLFNERWGFSAAGSFVLIGCLTLVFNTIVSARMSSYFFPYFAEKILMRYTRLRMKGDVPENPCYLVIKKYRPLELLLLFYFCKKLDVVVLAKPMKKFPWITGFVNSIFFLSPATNHNTTLKRLFIRGKRVKTKDNFVAIFVEKDYEDEMILKAYDTIFGHQTPPKLLLAQCKKKKKRNYLEKRHYVYNFQELR